MSRRERYASLPTPQEFGAKVRELREQHGFESQRALARALKCSNTTVSHIEIGRNRPMFGVTVGLLRLLPELADYLGCGMETSEARDEAKERVA